MDERTAGDVTDEFERALEERDARRYVLRLYIAGNSPRSQTAIENVKQLCGDYLKDRCDLEIIDIYQTPTEIPEHAILAAPTLIRQLPLPIRKVIGDMTKKEKVLLGLDLIPRG